MEQIRFGSTLTVSPKSLTCSGRLLRHPDSRIVRWIGRSKRHGRCWSAADFFTSEQALTSLLFTRGRGT